MPSSWRPKGLFNRLSIKRQMDNFTAVGRHRSGAATLAIKSHVAYEKLSRRRPWVVLWSFTVFRTREACCSCLKSLLKIYDNRWKLIFSKKTPTSRKFNSQTRTSKVRYRAQCLKFLEERSSLDLGVSTKWSAVNCEFRCQMVSTSVTSVKICQKFHFKVD